MDVRASWYSSVVEESWNLKILPFQVCLHLEIVGFEGAQTNGRCLTPEYMRCDPSKASGLGSRSQRFIVGPTNEGVLLPRRYSPDREGA